MASETEDSDSSDSSSDAEESADLCSELLKVDKNESMNMNRSTITSGKLRPPRKKGKTGSKASFSTSFTRKVKTNNVSLAKNLAKIKGQYQALQANNALIHQSKTDLAMKYNSDILYCQEFAHTIESRLKDSLQSAYVFIGHIMEIQSIVDDFKKHSLTQPPMHADSPTSTKQGSTSSKTQSVCPMVSGHTMYRPKLSLQRIEMPSEAVSPLPQTEQAEAQMPLLPVLESPQPSQQAEPNQDGNVQPDNDEEQVSLLCRKRRKRNAEATDSQLRETPEAFYQRVLSEDPLEGTSHRSSRTGLRGNPPKDYCLPTSSSSSEDEEELNRTTFSVKDMDETNASMGRVLNDNAPAIQKACTTSSTNGPTTKPQIKNESQLANNKHISGRRKPVRLLELEKEPNKDLNQTHPVDDLEASIAKMSPILKENVSSFKFAATANKPGVQPMYKNDSQLTGSDKPKSKPSKLADNVKHQKISTNEFYNTQNTTQSCNKLQYDVPHRHPPSTVTVDAPEHRTSSTFDRSTASRTLTCNVSTPNKIKIRSALDASDDNTSNKSGSATASQEPYIKNKIFNNNNTEELRSPHLNQVRSPHLNNNRQLLVTCNKLPSQLDAKTLLQLASPLKHTPLASPLKQTQPASPLKQTPICNNMNGIGNHVMNYVISKSAVETRTLRVAVDRLPLSKSAEPDILAVKERANKVSKRRCAKRQADSSRNSETPTLSRLPKTTRVFEEQIENKTSVIIKQELLSPSQDNFPRRTRSALGKIIPPNYKELSLQVKMRREDTENTDHHQ